MSFAFVWVVTFMDLLFCISSIKNLLYLNTWLFVLSWMLMRFVSTYPPKQKKHVNGWYGQSPNCSFIWSNHSCKMDFKLWAWHWKHKLDFGDVLNHFFYSYERELPKLTKYNWSSTEYNYDTASSFLPLGLKHYFCADSNKNSPIHKFCLNF